jgi:hypothetical protein
MENTATTLTTVEEMIILGFRNGMSFAQVEARIPALASKKLGINVKQFHRHFEDATAETLNTMVKRVVSQFTPEEQVEIAARKGTNISKTHGRS